MKFRKRNGVGRHDGCEVCGGESGGLPGQEVVFDRAKLCEPCTFYLIKRLERQALEETAQRVANAIVNRITEPRQTLH